MPLRNTQKLICDVLTSTDALKGYHPAEKLIRNTGSLSPHQRLEIYRNTSLTARINALRQIYPVCESILGTRIFSNLARDYALDNIALSPDLNLYGSNFNHFIDTVQQIVALGDYQYLKDLCRLEWLWHATYYRENDNPFDFNAFEICCEQSGEIILILSHALEIMVSNYPVHLIWKQHRTHQPSHSVAGLQEAEYLCIYRDEFVPKVEKINQPLFELLNACRQEHSLQRLSSDRKLASVIQNIPFLIERGWISGFTHQTDLNV